MVDVSEFNDAITAILSSDQTRVSIENIVQDRYGREQIRQSDLQRAAASALIRLNNSDILTDPKPLPNGRDAVLLTKIIVDSPTSCHLAIKAYQVPGKTELDFVLICFVPDHQNTMKSRFSTLEPVLLEEITRQLRITCTGPGDALFGMTIVQNYFDEHSHDNEHDPEAEHTDSSALPNADDQLIQAQQANSYYPPLPPVAHATNLL